MKNYLIKKGGYGSWISNNPTAFNTSLKEAQKEQSALDKPITGITLPVVTMPDTHGNVTNLEVYGAHITTEKAQLHSELRRLLGTDGEVVAQFQIKPDGFEGGLSMNWGNHVNIQDPPCQFCDIQLRLPSDKLPAVNVDEEKRKRWLEKFGKKSRSREEDDNDDSPPVKKVNTDTEDSE